MEKFIIQGKSKLRGSIAVKGAKNHALKAMAAALLSDQPIRLTNVPEIQDIYRMKEILEGLGAKIRREKAGTYQIRTSEIKTSKLSTKLVPKLRASIVLTGPLLARQGKVVFPHPGGCAIGRRPIDLFVSAYRALGAKYSLKGTLHTLTAPRGLRGAKIIFPKVTVTGTETIMLAATLANGKTTIVNAAVEPEIGALARYLVAHGARITGIGTNQLVIHGVKKLRAGECAIIPDRIETLSFLFLALANKSKLKITQCDPSHIEAPLALLKQAGARITTTNSSITMYPWKRLQPMRVTTTEYPGFPTDGQSPLTVLLTQIEGESTVEETIYTDRLFFTDLLNRMGANIVMHTPQHITIHGTTPLRAKVVESPDLRAGIAMVIAASIAEGISQINNVYQIDRGYETIDKRLRSIGMNIKRVK